MRSERSAAGWPLKIAAAGGLLFLHLPILLMSGQDLRPAQNPQLPDVELLRKPFTRVQLAQALQRIAKIES